MDINDFIGTGPTFPIALDGNGSPVISGGAELVTSSIKMILAWPKNQRIFLSKFGANLENLLEEPNDQLLQGLVEYYISDGLKTWEKRIKVLDVTVVRTEPSKLNVTVTYKLSNETVSQVFTFPFYPMETAVLQN